MLSTVDKIMKRRQTCIVNLYADHVVIIANDQTSPSACLHIIYVVTVIWLLPNNYARVGSKLQAMTMLIRLSVAGHEQVHALRAATWRQKPPVASATATYLSTDSWWPTWQSNPSCFSCFYFIFFTFNSVSTKLIVGELVLSVSFCS